MKTSSTIVAIAVAVLASTPIVHAQHFSAGQLVVLRAGNGTLDLRLKQAPLFLDQFNPETSNAAPTYTLTIPTNGPDGLFFNGHAATEGNLTRSDDRKLLAFAGYAGVSLLQSNGIPSQLQIPRGFCTVGTSGASYTLVYQSLDWYPTANPRGIVTDGSNNFWGCGNSYGTVYYDPKTAAKPLQLKAFPSTRAVKIINHVVYATLNSADGIPIDQPAGIYSFYDGSTPLPLPEQEECQMKLVVRAGPSFKKTSGFDLNPEATIAYMADADAGIQKYVKTGGDWKFAYSFTMPETAGQNHNHGTGCFGLTVDFSGKVPVIYATTTEGEGGVNANRLVRIMDTGADATVTTIAQAGANMAFRGVEFAPQAPPVTASK